MTAPEYWFDHSALVADSGPRPQGGLRGQVRALKSYLTTPASGTQVRHFSESNGLEFQGQTYDELPGMIFRSAQRRDMVRAPGPPLVEFGGCSSLGQNMPYFFGYVAVRHDLDLPHLVFDARANDSTAPNGSGIYAKQDSHSSLTANFRGSDAATPMGNVRSKVKLLDLGPAADQQMRVFAQKDRLEDARRFLTGSTLQYFLGAARFFDIEVVDGWVFLYSYGREVTGTSAEGWAWIFSRTSRLLDQVDDWARVASPLEGAKPHVAAGAKPAFYTREDIRTPAALENGPVKASPGREAFSDFLWR